MNAPITPQTRQPRNRGRWSDEDGERLRQMWNAGAPMAELCEAFNRDRGSVDGQLTKLRKAGADVVRRTRGKT